MGIFSKNKKSQEVKNMNIVIPTHIAIIMDGNGRWAKKRGLPRVTGHIKGGQTFRTIVRYCGEIGVKFLTIYAFSTENWKRPQEEVSALMDLFDEYLDEIIRDFSLYNMKLNFIGDIDGLSDKLKSKIEVAKKRTEDLTGITLNLAINYGARQEILNAVKKISEKCIEKEININDITEDTISENLYTSGQPDPDLIIRPSGELRISNFVLWQSAYSEFWFTDKYWPDFTPKDIDRAIEDYSLRNRRFGGI